MPVDRMRMRPWLEQQINSGQIQGLQWVDEAERIFQIPWMHAARHGWDLEKDAPLFQNWAVHTGRYCPGVDKPDPKIWKANFRCALNSLPDIQEVKDKSMKKGRNAFRMYRILSLPEKAARIGKKKSDLLHRSKQDSQKRSGGVPQKYTLLKVISQTTSQEEMTPDSTVLFTEPEASVEADLPDVCAVVEVATERDTPPERDTPMQRDTPPERDTPTEACPSLQDGCVWSGQESVSEDDSPELPEDLSVRAWGRGSVLRVPAGGVAWCEKRNLRVTSLREACPQVSYHSAPWFPYRPADSALDLSAAASSSSSLLYLASSTSSPGTLEQHHTHTYIS